MILRNQFLFGYVLMRASGFVKADQEKLLRSMLQRRLAPYRIFLGEEQENPDAPVFDLRFSKAAQQLLNKKFNSSTIGIQLLLKNQGRTLGEVYAQRLIGNRNAGFVIAVLLDQLMLDWAPLIRDLTPITTERRWAATT